MADRTKQDRAKFVRIVCAVLFSVLIHIQFFVLGDFILNRKAGQETESRLPVKVFLIPEKDALNASSVAEVAKEPEVKDLTSGSEIKSDINQESVVENYVKEIPANEAGNYSETVVPPWEIDVPPKLLTPGDIGTGMDNTPLLDALPLIASIYLDEAGSPFLIIYDPMPNQKALRRLNKFFSTSVFSAAMVENRSVPSVLNLPLSIKGFS